GGSKADGGAGWGGGPFTPAGGSPFIQQTPLTPNTAMGGLPRARGSDGHGGGGGPYVATRASRFLKETTGQRNGASTSHDKSSGTVTSLGDSSRAPQAGNSPAVSPPHSPRSASPVG